MLPEKILYQEKGLFLQSLHPLAALSYLGVLLLLALIFSNPLYLLGMLLVTGLAIWAADGLAAWESYIKIAFYMVILVMIINPILAHSGQTVLWQGPRIPLLGRPAVTLESVSFAAAMSIRLLDIISIFCLYNLIVHPDKALNFFSRFAGKAVLVISLAVRLFPVMAGEMENIRGMQQMRGVDFSKGSLRERFIKHSRLIGILLVKSLEDSLETAESMHARAFGSGRRTYYSRNLWRPRDVIVLSCSMCAAAAGIWGVLHGFGGYSFYPALGCLINGAGTAAVLIIVLISSTIPLLAGWGWSHWHYLQSKI